MAHFLTSEDVFLQHPKVEELKTNTNQYEIEYENNQPPKAHLT